MNKQEALKKLTALEHEVKKLREIIEAPVHISKEKRFWGLWSGLTMKVDRDQYPKSTFWFAGDDLIIEWQHIYGQLWISHSDIWSVFEKEYGLNYNDIQSFIKVEVEKHFKIGSVTPIFKFSVSDLRESYIRVR